MKGNQPISRASRAAEAAGEEMRRLAGAPAVQRAVGRARDAARQTASRMPRGAEPGVVLSAADLQGVRTTDVLIDGVEARAARRTARSLGLPRTTDDAAAWAALGALAALVRVADDGRRRAVVVDCGTSRSLFTRWAARVGFVPVHLDVMAADVVGRQIDPDSVDLVVAIHPRSSAPDEVDVDLVHAATCLRQGGLVVITLHLGPGDQGGVGVAELRSLIARADEQGLSLVGDLDIHDHQRTREAAADGGDRTVGLALLSFRRR